MTLDREFDRIASAWLADGPTELSDRVLDAVVDEVHSTRQRRAVRAPWRFPTMSMPARVAALVAVGVLAIAGAVAIGGIGGLSRSTPTPTPTSPSTSSATLADQLPALDTRFTSAWHGYSVRYPSAWAASPADRAWKPGTRSLWGDPELDQIKSNEIRFIAEQQPYAPGQTPAQWLQGYCRLDGATDCAATVASWKPIKVAGSDAFVDVDGVKAAPNTVYPGGLLYEAIVPTTTRAYVFTLDGHVDRSVFDAFLATITLSPSDAVDTAPLTGRFTSPLYGYTIGTAASWTPTAATNRWTSTIPDSGFMDGLDVTSDTNVGAMSQALGGRTFDDFLAAFYQGQHATYAGTGCDDGGDPSTWPTIPIGDQTGRLEVVCSAASDEALVAVGGRVYLFELGHSNLSFPLTAFKQLLKTVTFSPLTADRTTTFTSPTYGYSILINPTWTPTNAAKPWRDYGNSNDFMDSVEIGSGQGMGMMSQALGSRTFDQFVNTFYQQQLAAIGSGCAGGDPSTWPDIQIGDRTGKVELQCGSDEALVQAGDRVYLFEIGNRADPNPLVSLDAWKVLLRGVILDPASAKS